MSAEVVRVEVAPGAGWLARRAGALLWTPATERPDELLTPFMEAADAEAATAAVTSATVAAAFAVAPFALVGWEGGLHVLVLGDVAVETDVPSLPMLSGAGSGTWVEHRARPTGPAAVVAGAPAVDGTDLRSGVIRADGFRLIVATEAVPAAVPVAAAEEAPEPAAAPPPAAWPQPDVASTATRGAALLDQVTGGDWMDDSIGLDPRGLPVAVAPTGDPDDEDTIDEPLPTFAAPGDAAAVIARRCRRGHPNPPHAASCRQCGELLDPSVTTEPVPQPVLGTIVTFDGRAVPIAGTIVVGRRPDAAAARVDGRTEHLTVAAEPGVSRTHLVVRAEGWAITVTDCNSRGGTILRRGGDDPLPIPAWTPHEVGPGDVVHLGGPATIRIADA